MTPENSGMHLWPCDNPRWCPSPWQAAQWSSSGDAAGPARAVRGERDALRRGWAGIGGKGRVMRSKQEGHQARDRPADVAAGERSHPDSGDTAIWWGFSQG